MSMSSVPCNSSIRFLYWSFFAHRCRHSTPNGGRSSTSFRTARRAPRPVSRFKRMSVLRTKIGDSALALNCRGAAFWPNYGNSDIGATGSSAALRVLSTPGTRRSPAAANAGRRVRPRWAGPCRWRRCRASGYLFAGIPVPILMVPVPPVATRPATTGARHHAFTAPASHFRTRLF